MIRLIDLWVAWFGGYITDQEFMEESFTVIVLAVLKRRRRKALWGDVVSVS